MTRYITNGRQLVYWVITAGVTNLRSTVKCQRENVSPKEYKYVQNQYMAKLAKLMATIDNILLVF